MTEHEFKSIDETFFTLEDGKPTLWDNDGPGRTRAVVLTKDDGHILITSDPQTVEEFLDD